MTAEQKDRIEKINIEILALILKRKQTQRRGTWAQEQVIFEEIDKLEEKIKGIEAE